MKTVGDLESAMAAVDRELAALIPAVTDRALTGSDGSGILEFAAWAERLRSKLAVIDHHVVIELEATNAADDQLMRSTAHLLAARLRIGRGEARRRVEAAAMPAPHV